MNYKTVKSGKAAKIKKGLITVMSEMCEVQKQFVDSGYCNHLEKTVKVCRALTRNVYKGFKLWRTSVHIFISSHQCIPYAL